MKNTITRVDALNYAIECIENENSEMAAILEKIRDQIAKPRKSSDEAKEKAKVKRANARAELMAQVLPIVREGIGEGGTAKEIYERCADALPADFTAAKVQAVLLREMKDELIKVEQKGKPNVYKMKG